MQQIKYALQILTAADDGDVIKKSDVKKKMGKVGLNLEEDGVENQGKEEGSERVPLLSPG